MKKLFISLLLAGATLPAPAQHHGHHFRHHMHRSHGPSWGYIVAPLVIGGIAGAAIVNNRQPETVIINQPLPVNVQNQNCTPWTETQSSDGTITRTRTCTN